jgi:Zn-dependent protease
MLGWSINLFRIFGIQLAVHASFVLLLAWFGWEGWVEAGTTGMWWSLLLIVLFFACVVLHELGHSLTARRYGVRTPRILLMPIGGMAEMDRIPRRPSAEMLITVAGPAVNFVVAGLLLAVMWTTLASGTGVPQFGLEDLGIQLLKANLLMGIFNLLPVFPMDGGRILRALLATRLPYLRATWWAATVGKVLAAALAIVALVYFEWLLLFALFVFIFFAADAEYRQVRRREEELAYYAELARQIGVVKSPASDRDDPPEPPLLFHGRN